MNFDDLNSRKKNVVMQNSISYIGLPRSPNMNDLAFCKNTARSVQMSSAIDEYPLLHLSKTFQHRRIIHLPLGIPRGRAKFLVHNHFPQFVQLQLAKKPSQNIKRHLQLERPIRVVQDVFPYSPLDSGLGNVTASAVEQNHG